MLNILTSIANVKPTHNFESNVKPKTARLRKGLKGALASREVNQSSSFEYDIQEP